MNRSLFAITLAAFAAFPVFGQTTLVSYPFSSNTTPTTVAPGITPTLSFTNLSSSLVANDGFGVVLQAYPGAGATSAPLALSSNSYYSLALALPSPSTGPVTVAFNVGKGGNSDPRGYFVRTSLDNFGSDVGGGQLPTGAQAAPAPASVNLTLSGQSTLTIRFYVWTPIPGGNSVDFSNLTVSGTLSAVQGTPISKIGRAHV